MKKIGLLISGLMCGQLIMAQAPVPVNGQDPFSNTLMDEYQNEKVSNIARATIKSTHKQKASGSLAAPGDTLLHETFGGSGTSLPNGWKSTRAAGPSSAAWVRSTVMSQGQYARGTTTIRSSTTTNGFLMLDCDAYNPGSPPFADIDCALELPKQNFSSVPSVILKFESYFRPFSAAVMSIEVSTDGTNWKVAKDVRNGVPSNSASNNHMGDTAGTPYVQKVNLTNDLGGKANAYIRFRWSGSSHYFWQLDDIMILKGGKYNMRMDKAYLKEPLSDSTYFNYEQYYTKMPMGQAQATDLQSVGVFSNVGASVLSGAGFKVYVKGPQNYTASYSSIPQNLGTTATDSSSLTSAFKLTAGRGLYRVNLHTYADSALDFFEDDTITFPIEVTDSVFARDRNNPAGGGSFYWTANPFVYEAGSTFELSDADEIKAVQIYLPTINASGATGAKVSCHVYRHGGYATQRGFYRPPATGPVFSSGTPFTLNSTNTGRWITVPLNRVAPAGAGDTVAAGFYVATFMADQNFGTDTVHFSIDDQKAHFANNFVRTDPAGSGSFGTWSSTPNRFYVRLLTKSNSCPILDGEALGTATSSCGQTDGSATISKDPTNGTAPYAYTWNINGTIKSGKTQSNLSSGVYNVTILDAKGCTQNATATVSDAGAPIITNQTVTPVTCVGFGQGSISFNLTPGTTGPGYTITWYDGKGKPMGRGDSTLSNVETGTYTVKIADGAFPPCLQTRAFSVTGPADTLKVRPMQVDDVSCFGKTDGRVSYASATGGSGPGSYTFKWWDGNTSDAVRNGLAAGAYGITVTDANNCTAVSSVSVGGPSAIAITFATIPSNNEKVTITAGVNGGTPNYAYDWRNKDNVKCISSGATMVVGPKANPTAGIQDGAGVYTVKVTDNNTCTNTKDVTVDDAFLAPLSVSSITDKYSVSVYPNPSNGSFSLNMKNVDAGNYSLEIKNVVGQSVYSKSVDVSGVYSENIELNNVEAGVYFLTISNNGSDNTLRLVIE
ncbi:MAG: T9SS type A sorting domain-containing protein [Flavobacteriales bacterium]|nr:T9SS type A sorting domain-containing protein [Flavobacteriales bacterium]